MLFLFYFCCVVVEKSLIGILKIRFVECFLERGIKEECKIDGLNCVKFLFLDIVRNDLKWIDLFKGEERIRNVLFDK